MITLKLGDRVRDPRNGRYGTVSEAKLLSGGWQIRVEWDQRAGWSVIEQAAFLDPELEEPALPPWSGSFG